MVRRTGDALPLLEFVAAALATWRVAVLLVEDDGPYLVFRKLRALAGVTRPAPGVVIAPTDLRGAFGCVRCMSLYVAAVAAAWVYDGGWEAYVGTWLGLAGAAAAIEVFRK